MMMSLEIGIMWKGGRIGVETRLGCGIDLGCEPFGLVGQVDEELRHFDASLCECKLGLYRTQNMAIPS